MRPRSRTRTRIHRTCSTRRRTPIHPGAIHPAWVPRWARRKPRRPLRTDRLRLNHPVTSRRFWKRRTPDTVARSPSRATRVCTSSSWAAAGRHRATARRIPRGNPRIGHSTKMKNRQLRNRGRLPTRPVPARRGRKAPRRSRALYLSRRHPGSPPSRTNRARSRAAARRGPPAETRIGANPVRVKHNTPSF